MNQDLQKQNKMLKDYVIALEGQNKSRNIEKDVLLREIDNLTSENNELRNQLSRSSQSNAKFNEKDILIKGNKDLQEKLSKLSADLQNILKIKSEMQSQKVKLKQEIQNLARRVQQLQIESRNQQTTSTDLLRLKTENEQLKKQNNLIQLKQNEIIKLENTNRQLQQKSIEMQSRLKSSMQHNEGKVSQARQLQTQNIKQSIRKQLELQMQYEINEVKRQYINMLQEKDRLLLESKSKLTEAQAKLYSNQRNVNNEVLQLRNLRRDLQSKVSMYERDRANLQINLNELKGQIAQKNEILAKREQDRTELENIKSSILQKDQHIEKSAVVIGALKDNIRSLERKSQQLQKSLQESGLQNKQTSNLAEKRKQVELETMQQRYRMEIDELNYKLSQQSQEMPQLLNQERKFRDEKQRENEELKKIIRGLSENNNILLQKLKDSQQDQVYRIQQRKEESNRNNEQDLRNVVEDLRNQLKSVRSDFKKIQQENRRMEQLFSSRINQNLVKNERIISNNESDHPSYTYNKSLQQKDRKIGHHLTEISPKHYQSPMNAEKQDQEVRYSKLGYNSYEKGQLLGSKIQNSGKPMNRDKWQALQRRITQLRQQNAQLKQSLYS